MPSAPSRRRPHAPDEHAISVETALDPAPPDTQRTFGELSDFPRAELVQLRLRLATQNSEANAWTERLLLHQRGALPLEQCGCAEDATPLRCLARGPAHRCRRTRRH
jgi:hypothetical protein